MATSSRNLIARVSVGGDVAFGAAPSVIGAIVVVLEPGRTMVDVVEELCVCVSEVSVCVGGWSE